MNQLKVVVSKGNNRLSLTISGVVTKKDLGKLYTELRFCVPDLQADFDVVSDLSGCSFAFLNIIPTFRNIMSYLLSNGAGEMVCIMLGSSLIYKQIQLATVFQGYKPCFVSTLEEAEEHLVTCKRRSALRFVFYKQPVQYITGAGENKSQLRDISISGCAINAADSHVSTGEELRVTIPLIMQDESVDSAEIMSEVVRVENDFFAVKFTDISDDRKKLLWDILVRESQLEKK